MNLIDNATRFLFFTGKGGVGKTSISSRRNQRLFLSSQVNQPSTSIPRRRRKITASASSG